jgi:outer membrane protein, heavy metal efflux system
MPFRSVPVPIRISVSVACVLSACSAPAERPLEPRELTAAVELRRDTPEQLANALALAGLAPLSVEPPTSADLADPTRPAFWHAAAWAWSPEARAARRTLAAARARARSAGAPGPIEGEVEIEDGGDLDAMTRASLSFDVVGLLGLGPSAAARALADAETRAAQGELERAVWRTRFEVDAARSKLAASRAALETLRALASEAQDSRVRIEILARNGRLEAAALASAELSERGLAQRISALELEESRAAEQLAVLAGLPPHAEALDAPSPLTLDEVGSRPAPQEPEPIELLERLPELRVSLLEYALAEARLREAAAQRWPELRLGPHLLWEDGDFLLGLLASAGIPWPGSLDGEIAAASEEREAARERTEDALLAAQAALQGARERAAVARRLLERDASSSAEQSARMWTAARARFAVEPAALMEWSSALRMRAEALAELAEARGELALATLDLEQAAGPAPEALRVALAQEVRP